MWVNSTSKTLKLYNGTEIVELGSTDGVTTEELEIALSDYTDTAALNLLLGGYVTEGELTTALESYVTEAELTTALQPYAKTSEVVTQDKLDEVTDRLVDSFKPFDSASALSHTITHNLNYRWPIVQVIDAATNKQIIPDDIEYTSATVLTVKLGVAAAIKVSVSWAAPAA